MSKEKIKVFRFMSKMEFFDYLFGETLCNDKVHTSNTNSVGFCFLSLEDWKPATAYHFMTGIADMEICAVFEANLEDLNQTYGVYRDPRTVFHNIMKTKEYCTTKYNKQTFKLVKYARPYWSFDLNEKWHWKYANGEEVYE